MVICRLSSIFNLICLDSARLPVHYISHLRQGAQDLEPDQGDVSTVTNGDNDSIAQQHH